MHEADRQLPRLRQRGLTSGLVHPEERGEPVIGLGPVHQRHIGDVIDVVAAVPDPAEGPEVLLTGIGEEWPAERPAGLWLLSRPPQLRARPECRPVAPPEFV